MATVTSSKRHLLVTSDTYTSNGDVTVGGDLFVNGSQTVINTATLNVEDKNISLNYGGTESSSQDAGITIVGSNATILWDEANTRFRINNSLKVDGSITATRFHTPNDAGNNLNSRYTVYDDGSSVSYGMTLWNTNGTSGEWATMIYGPNQGSRRISFGKANSTFASNNNHAGIDELAYIDLDNGNFYADGTVTANGTVLTGATDISGKVSKTGDTMTGNLNLTYAYPRINLTDTNHNSDYSIINNDGAFSIYDVTNNSHRLSISSSGNTTFAGTIGATNFSGSSSGTNTGDQDLSGYATTGSIPTDFVSKANGGTFGGSVRFDGNIMVDTNTNTNTLNISRSGSTSSQVVKIGVTDTQAIFNYVEDTSSEGTGNFGQYLFKLGGNDGETTVTAFTITKTGVSAPNLSGTNTGDQVLPTDFVSKANGGTFSGDVIVNGQLTLGNTSQDPKNIVISQISGDNSEKTSLMLDGNGVVVTRELGTGAFTSTPTDFVSAANGGTFADSINVHGNILLTGAATSTNQDRTIDFTGFDKEGTTDFSDRAYIRHATNVGGHSGSVLQLSSMNDSGDGIAFTTHSSSLLKHNGHAIFTESHKPTWSEIDSKPSTFAPSAHNQAWNTITGTPTTLSGYGITDTIPSGSQLVRVLNNQDYIASGGTSGDYRDNYGAGLTVYEGYNAGANRPFTYDTTAQFMSNANQGFELAIDWVSASTTPLKIRSLRDCCQGWNPWTNVWTSHNFTLGTGGGLDADKVDGKHASDFAAANHNHDSRYVRVDVDQTLNQAYNFANTGNQFNSHLYYNSYDSNGNHYYHYRVGSNASQGTTINFRQYYNATSYLTHVWKATSASNAYFDFAGELRPNKIACDGEISAIGDIKVGSTTDGSQRVLRLYSYSADSKHSTIKTTNGNLHIDSEDGHSLYLNYYEGASTNIYFGTGNGGYCGTVSSAGLLRMANDVVAYYSFSDRRLKANIKTTENNLEKILSLNPVEYTWKEGPREGVKEIGLIAQEVEEVVPEVVRVQSRHHDEKSEGEEYKQVDYEHLVSTLIGAMQEQQQQIDELKAQMAACEERSCNCKK